MKDFHYSLKELTLCIMDAKELDSVEKSHYVEFQVENSYQFPLYSCTLPVTTAWDKIPLHK